MHGAHKYKKWILFIIIIGFTVLVSGCIYSIYKSRIDSAMILYDAIDNTADDILNKINSSPAIQNIYNSSFSLKLIPIYNASLHFTELNITNDKKTKQLTANIMDYKYDDNRALSLSVFANNKKLGFLINNSSEYCYTADSDNFKTKWNKSIYSRFYTIPSFCPEDMSYNNLNSLLRADNIIKILLAFGLGDADIDASDFIYNIKINSMSNIRVADKKTSHIRVKLSPDYCLSLMDKLSESSSIARQSFVSAYVELFKKSIKALRSDDIIIEFLIADNMIYSAETSLEFDRKLTNIILKYDRGGISISARDLFSEIYSADTNNWNFKIAMDNKPRVYLSDKKTILAAAYIDNPESGVSEISFSFLDNKRKPSLYRLSLSNNIASPKLRNKGKNIYSLTLFDIYKLYNKIRDYPDSME